MKATIICIGNRFVPADAAGPTVYDRLRELALPTGEIDLVDGGLQGLNLLPLLERGGRVVFVDAVSGFVDNDADRLVLLDGAEISTWPEQHRFDHGAGIGYLLAVLPQVCDGEMPREIAVVGIEGTYDAQLIERAARLSIEVARHGLQGSR
ncbi:hydrogenase maturation protease [Desulfofustis glycolicus]|uniref:Hydrogenase maturation protease n=1 Tax=Desulfofustis glycolicus DSM 9705 TaxID=1121409 RepID=A0A1M5V7S1_9BACT|nr:hydrogenase maturation protease [Desulfofustis glycolicus]MCB2214923.1 hydrogenase maturation protease [Desulfobulbaceae bacterium]SHH71265.1 hydrogenase maturation protease [Desulfofustis glycolicus DSM 9705]